MKKYFTHRSDIVSRSLATPSSHCQNTAITAHRTAHTANSHPPHLRLYFNQIKQSVRRTHSGTQYKYIFLRKASELEYYTKYDKVRVYCQPTKTSNHTPCITKSCARICSAQKTSSPPALPLYTHILTINNIHINSAFYRMGSMAVK